MMNFIIISHNISLQYSIVYVETCACEMFIDKDMRGPGKFRDS